MPIIIDEVTADIAPPPRSPASGASSPGQTAVAPDPAALRRELERLTERALRIHAD